MGINIINFQRQNGDLPRFPEYWQKSLYDETYRGAFELMTAKNGFPPLGHAKLIRACSFQIKGSVTLEHLKRLAVILRDKFGIDCFQISIDRNRQMAMMSFNWVKEDGSTIILNHIDMKRFQVIVFEELKLPRPQCCNEWLRYFLIYAYEKDEKVFQKQLDALYNQDTDGVDMVLLRDIILHAEGMCKGRFK